MVFQVCGASSEPLLIKRRAKNSTKGFSPLQPGFGHSLVRHHTHPGVGTHSKCRSSSSKVCPLLFWGALSQKYHGLHSTGVSGHGGWGEDLFCRLEGWKSPNETRQSCVATAWSRCLPLHRDQYQSPNMSPRVCCSHVCKPVQVPSYLNGSTALFCFLRARL